MTLNASGPISMGGSTAGQSINLELGQSATATITMNDANVRALAGVPSGAISFPSNFYGKSNVVGFSNFFYGSNGSSYDPIPTYQPLVNSSGQIYIAGNSHYNGTGLPVGVFVQKIDTNGSTLWKNLYSGSSSTNFSGDGFIQQSMPKNAIDSSGNVYITAMGGVSGVPGFVLMKLDPSGSVTWTKQLDFSSLGFQQYIIGTAVDSSGNIISAVLYLNNASVYYGTVIFKFDSSGTLLWQKELGATGGGRRLFGLWNNIATDSSNNIYVGGRMPDVFNQDAPTVAKLNSSGVFQWCQIYSSTATSGANGQAQGIIVTSSDALYMCCRYNNNTGWNDSFVFNLSKTDGSVIASSGLRIGDTSSHSYGFQSIASDSSSNICLSSGTYSGGYQAPVVVKYNSALSSVSWQGSFNGSSSGTILLTPCFSTNGGSFVLSGFGQTPQPTATATGALTFQLPTSALTTGTLTFSTSPTGNLTVASTSYVAPPFSVLGTIGATFTANTSTFPVNAYTTTVNSLTAYSNQVRNQP